MSNARNRLGIPTVDLDRALAGTVDSLDGVDDPAVILGHVEAAGGQVLEPKSRIGKNGFVGFFLDGNGNRVGLQSMRCPLVRVFII